MEDDQAYSAMELEWEIRMALARLRDRKTRNNQEKACSKKKEIIYILYECT